MKLFVFLLLSLPTFCLSQKIGNGVENIYRSVGFITYIDSAKGMIHSGTGTLIYKIPAKDMISIFLVTCKHVLPNFSQSRFIEFNISNPTSPTKVSILKVPIFDSTEKWLPFVKTDPLGNDLVVINISFLFSNPIENNLIQYIIPYNLLATKDSVVSNNIKAGDEILFIGYPSFFFDKRNISPIIRGGIIATPPEEDFYFNDLLRLGYITAYKEPLPEKFNGFFIDASAVGGSSGSLVFLKPYYIRVSNGQLQYTKEGVDPLILGILTTSYLDLDTRAANQKINLGGVISAEAIKRTIDSYKPSELTDH